MLNLTQSEPIRPKKAIQLPPKVKNDVFLNAILEIPTNVRPRRSPLQWAGAAALHIGVIAALLIVPLYTTGAIHLSELEETRLVAPPPPPPPPPLGQAVPRVTHPPVRSTFKVPKLVAPTSIPKKISTADQAGAPPQLDSLVSSVANGVAGGEIGGVLGGVLGGVGIAAPPNPPSQPLATKKIIRVGLGIKAPRQTYSVDPAYPALALQARVSGTVLVDAVIDEHGNVVQAHATSGNPFLIPAALQAVLQWRYEPTYLNGQPISVVLQVQVHFQLRRTE